MVVSFSITYLKVVVQADMAHILGLMLIAHVASLLAVPLCGYLSDRIGRKPVTAVGLALIAVWGNLHLGRLSTPTRPPRS